MSEINLFVYGTIRPGGINYYIIEDAVLSTVEDVTVPGKLYFLPGFHYDRPGYPLARFDEEGTIHGMILVCDTDNPWLARCVNMECGAGYSLEVVETSHGMAIGFQYENRLGDPIEGGNWLDVERRFKETCLYLSSFAQLSPQDS